MGIHLTSSITKATTNEHASGGRAFQHVLVKHKLKPHEIAQEIVPGYFKSVSVLAPLRCVEQLIEATGICLLIIVLLFPHIYM